MKSGPSNKKPGQRKSKTTGFWVWFVAGTLIALTISYLAATGRLTRHSTSYKAGRVPEEAALYRTYGTSPSCKNCHEEAYRLWQPSHHAQAERLVDPAIDSVAFQNHFKIRHGSNVDQIRSTNGIFEIITKGLDGQKQAFKPERVLAVNPLRQFLIPAPGGRYQLTELAFDPNHPDWFNVYGEDDRRPGEWGHWTGRGMTWNVMCAACHNTRVRKNYDGKTDSYRTVMAERGVGCEACHGPMADHNDWQAKHPNQKGDPTLTKMSRDQWLHTCGSCHSRRADLTGDFHPGENFFDHYSLSVPDDSDLFYPDGQIRDEDFELTAFLGSRMHASGIRCIDCHEPHGGKVRIPGNNLCMVCHAAPAPPAPKIDPATHSHHKLGGRGDQCVACHMPQTVYMQRHARHDHGFTIPDPLLTAEYGIPNACNRCHDERSPQWALEYADQWYGTRMDRPTRKRAQIMARAKAVEPGAKAELLGLLKTETNVFWRAVSVGFLRHYNQDPAVVEALVQVAGETNSLVRSMSLRSLEANSQETPRSVAEVFRKGLADPIRGVRLDAAWGLRSLLETNTLAGRDMLHYLALNQDQPSGALQDGVFHMDRGDLAGAMSQFRRALAWDTNSAALYHALAVALSMDNKPQEAAEALKTACRLDPANGEYRYKLGLALNETGNLGDAISALEEAVRLSPSYARGWYNLGLAYNSAGRADPALEALTRAETLEPASAQIPYARATILARSGRREEARQAAAKALSLQPQFEEAAALLQNLQR